MGENLWWHLSLLSRHEISVSFFSLSIMLLQNTHFGVRSYQFLLVRITCISKTDVALWTMVIWVDWMDGMELWVGWEEPYTAKKRWKRYLGAKLTPSVSCMEATLHRWVFIIWWNTKLKYICFPDLRKTFIIWQKTKIYAFQIDGFEENFCLLEYAQREVNIASMAWYFVSSWLFVTVTHAVILGFNFMLPEASFCLVLAQWKWYFIGRCIFIMEKCLKHKV